MQKSNQYRHQNLSSQIRPTRPVYSDNAARKNFWKSKKVSEYAGALFASHGDRAEAEAAEKAKQLEEAGESKKAWTCLAIRAAIHEIRGPHQSQFKGLSAFFSFNAAVRINLGVLVSHNTWLFRQPHCWANDGSGRIVLKKSVSGRMRVNWRNVLPRKHRFLEVIFRRVACENDIPRFRGNFQVAEFFNNIGAVPVLFGKTPSRSTRDMSLGFAAGVMLSASFFSLIIPSLEAASLRYGEGAVPASIAVIGILAGMAVVAWLNEVLPHEHFTIGREGPESAALRQIWLFIIAITIHNFPEGLAVGVGFGANGVSGGMPLAIGIGLQNLPEGLAVAVALLGEGYGRLKSFGVAALTGLIEPVGGLLGATLISFSKPFLPWGLAFAAGAMLYVISHEIIPETHSSGHQKKATFGLAVGLVLMLFLDVWLG